MKKTWICALLLSATMAGKAQTRPAANQLYQYGEADAFVNGVYKGELTLQQLLQKGDFGLGAPDFVDGELTIYNGKVYQTKASGQTSVAPAALTTPFAIVTFFRPDTVINLPAHMDAKACYAQLQQYLANRNGMYAIRISGTFEEVRTRAFPPLTQQPFPPLASVMDQQHFFTFNNVAGTMTGYCLPAYLAGVNIAGFHFHFLDDTFTEGGHVMAFTTAGVKVEIAELHGFTMDVPGTAAFKQYLFKKDNSAAVQTVEKGQ